MDIKGKLRMGSGKLRLTNSSGSGSIPFSVPVTTVVLAFDVDGGTPQPSSTLVPVSGEAGTFFYSSYLPTVTKTGYSFLNWRTAPNGGGDVVTGSTMITNSSTHILYAQWQLVTYSVTYNMNGGTNNAGNPNSYTILSYPSTFFFLAPTRIGYNFNGWSKISIAPGEVGNITNTASWTAKQYTVTLNHNGGSSSLNTITVTYDTLPSTLSPLPIRPGYTFQGYYTTSSGFGIIYFNANGTAARLWDRDENTTLFAQWTAITYSVTLDKQGGTGGTSTISATSGSATPSITVPSRTHYNFQGYYTGTGGSGTKIYNSDGSAVSSTWNITNTILYAYWIPIEWTITYAMNGGTNNPSNPTSYNITTSPFGFSSPTRTGYTFSGWSPSFIVPGSVTGNITVTASWTANTYTVTLDHQGGTSSLNSVTATFGSPLPSLSQLPSRSGYIFNGYFAGVNGTTPQYYTSSGSGNQVWNIAGGGTIYAFWTVDTGGGGGGCIAVDTPIVMEDGTTRRADEIYVGDRIRSYVINGMIDEEDPTWVNFTTDSTEGTYEVSTVKQADRDWFREYYLINNDLKITKQHEIFVKNSETGLWGWVEAPNISVGDSLFGVNGEEIEVTEIILVPERLDVITLNVEETDTYFGGNTPVLIHNRDLIKG
jgi:uncharacterized repeat protein (TIGR02543 family)